MRRARSKQSKALATTTGIPCRIVRSPVAGNFGGIGFCAIRIVRSGSRIPTQVGEFRVVEDVEGFGTKFKIFALRDREMLNQSHVEVFTPRIVENVSSGVAECKTGRRDECGGIEEQGAKAGLSTCEGAA